MTHPIVSRFTSSATMMKAEQELIALGSGAVPVLEAILNGGLTNEFGVPYRKLGLPHRCALEVAKRLGPIARPLESLLRADLRCGYFVAAQALGSLGVVDDESIEVLASHLDYDVNKASGFVEALDLMCECGAALVRLGHADHPVVVSALERSPRASADFARMSRSLQSRA